MGLNPPPLLRFSRMSRRGVVYVEFLLAFFPLFLLFLGICQLALIANARMIVALAAGNGARSAIVVLEDAPQNWAGAPRGYLSTGESNATTHLELLLASAVTPSEGGISAAPLPPGANGRPQQGARMTAIRAASYMPLLVLAPHAAIWAEAPPDDLAHAVRIGPTDLSSALAFTAAATAVTVHTSPDAGELPPEPIGPNQAVSVRVTYLLHCGVPIVRNLLCSSLERLLEAGSPVRKRLSFVEATEPLEKLTARSHRFLAISAVATLPNQGAAYVLAPEEEGEDASE